MCANLGAAGHAEGHIYAPGRWPPSPSAPQEAFAALLQVGGLRDTVHPYNPYENTGTGWSFEWADAGAFRDAIGNALYTYRCCCQA